MAPSLNSIRSTTDCYRTSLGRSRSLLWQNRRMVEVGRASGGLLVQCCPCSSRATQSRLSRTMSRQILSLPRSTEGDATTTLGNVCRCSVTCTVKKCFLMFRQSFLCFLFVPMASCPVTGHYWKEPGFILLSTSDQVFTYIDETPWAFYPPGLTVLALSACIMIKQRLSRVASQWHLPVPSALPSGPMDLCMYTLLALISYYC